MQICPKTRLDFGGKSWSRKNFKRVLKKRENLEKLCEHKLSRMDQNRIFRVLNFRKNGRNSRKLLLAKVSAPKVVEGAVPTIYAHLIFDQINMDGNKVLLTRHVSKNKRKRDAEKDHQQVSFVSP